MVLTELVNMPVLEAFFSSCVDISSCRVICPFQHDVQNKMEAQEISNAS